MVGFYISSLTQAWAARSPRGGGSNLPGISMGSLPSGKGSANTQQLAEGCASPGRAPTTFPTGTKERAGSQPLGPRPLHFFSLLVCLT